MYAVARIAGKQYRIEPNSSLKVPRLKIEEGKTYDIKDILFAVDDTGVKVGESEVKDVKIVAKVVSHGREDKITVFKKKRRQGFRVTKGHRQQYTLLQIDTIDGLKGEVKKAEAPKKAAKPKAKPKKKVEKTKAETKSKKETKPKAAPKKKAAPKAKPAAKKAAKPKAAAKPKKEAEPKAEAKPAAEKKAEAKGGETKKESEGE